MSGQEIAFVLVGLVGTFGALRLVTSRNVVHAALWLVVTLSAVAAVYLLLGAEFLAWVQVLVYVGAIVVLLLFALMLTRAPIGRDALDNGQRALAAVVSLAVLAGLLVLLAATFGSRRIPPHASATAALGTAIFRGAVLPFEVVSVLLLAALVGAIALARREEPE